MKEVFCKELQGYITKSGKEPFADWFKGLKDKTLRKRIMQRLYSLAMGNYGDSKAIGAGVYELRFHFGSGYRIYFSEVSEILIIILCAGDKKSQKKDIKLAKQFWQEFLENYDE